jgi:hypothetical protein
VRHTREDLHIDPRLIHGGQSALANVIEFLGPLVRSKSEFKTGRYEDVVGEHVLLKGNDLQSSSWNSGTVATQTSGFTHRTSWLAE